MQMRSGEESAGKIDHCYKVLSKILFLLEQDQMYSSYLIFLDSLPMTIPATVPLR